MKKQWNFIIENKLITVFDADERSAKRKAHKIFKDMQKSAS